MCGQIRGLLDLGTAHPPWAGIIQQRCLGEVYQLLMSLIQPPRGVASRKPRLLRHNYLAKFTLRKLLKHLTLLLNELLILVQCDSIYSTNAVRSIGVTRLHWLPIISFKEILSRGVPASELYVRLLSSDGLLGLTITSRDCLVACTAPLIRSS
jgi:hypothetical protein